ncbi:MAG: dioxygenase [Acidimicrobiaceae bacterium]|nr:dioxygenase [Acidimicrobiaceae bacterium]
MTATEIPDSGTDEQKPWHLSGNNAPVFDELTVTSLEVKGSIPSELAGRYFRNGANPQSGISDHWFVGDGMIHGIEIADGKANWYRNRYVRTPMFNNPDKDRMELYLDMETMGFNYEVSVANTSVLGHAGKIYALEEGSFPYELSKEVETIGCHTYGGKLTTAMTAHPKVCGETGELLMFGYSSLPPYLTYHRISPDGQLVQSEEITVGGPTMMHDFTVTRNHSIFLDLPAIFDMEMAMQGGMPIRWSDDYASRFGVMPRAGSDADVKWFDVNPCYVFHTLNSYEDGDEIVVNGCRLREIWRDSSEIAVNDAPDPADSPMMWEWRLNMKTGTVSERQIDDRGSEFPKLPDSLVGLQNRYGYCLSMGDGGISGVSEGGATVKYDLVNGGTSELHNFPKSHFPGEPSFVPAEGAKNEDDGYLMTYVYAGDTDTSYLAILDASNIASDPLAEIHVPKRVPTGFHGTWIADN